jgi:membrane protein implicated in regulation of membrane protease activity
MHTLGLIAPFMNWWEGLDTARQMFYGIGLVAGIISVVLAVLAMIGMEHHEGIDALGAHDAQTLSLKPVVGFFLGFGLAGGMALDAGLSLFVALVIALAAGAAVMGVIIALFRAIRSMRSDGTVRISESVGAIGTVYVTVPPRKAQGGQVVFNFSGRQETLSALTGGEQAIASGDKVKVVSVVDGRTVLVEAL